MSKADRGGQQPASIEGLIASIGTLIRNGQVLRSQLESVLTSRFATDRQRSMIITALRDAGVSVTEDIEDAEPLRESDQFIEEETPDFEPDEAPHRVSEKTRDSALAAARTVLERDRTTRNKGRKILSAEQEVGLALLMRGETNAPLEQGGYGSLSGERREAAESLFAHNVRLVHSVCQKYVGRGLEYEDLVQYGYFGLIRAIEKFDPTLGYKFSTYATWWLRQSVTRAIADYGRAIRLPVHMVDLLNRVWSKRDELTIDGVPPTIRELSKAAGIDPDKVALCMRLGRPMDSLDRKIGDDETTLGDLVDYHEDRPEHIEVHGLFPEDIDDLLAELTERESNVIRQRFGLRPFAERATLDEIGTAYGVTRERIRQIESKALGKIRAATSRLQRNRGAANVLFMDQDAE